MRFDMRREGGRSQVITRPMVLDLLTTDPGHVRERIDEALSDPEQKEELVASIAEMVTAMMRAQIDLQAGGSL